MDICFVQLAWCVPNNITYNMVWTRAIVLHSGWNALFTKYHNDSDVILEATIMITKYLKS